MITFTSLQLNEWIAAFMWPLTRILGLVAVAPLFGNVSIPVNIKIALSVMLALIVAPSLPDMSALDPMSMTGLLILIQQFIIGLSMGFVMRVTFVGIEMAGEVIGMTMGLGFATFFDPQSQGRSSAISQYLALLMLMVYLAANIHLILLSTLIDSFSVLPISPAPIGGQAFQQLAGWGGRIFSAGLQLSLPVVAALLIANIALGILTRAAPQLNLFGIGFPVTLTAGFVMIMLALPYMTIPIQRLCEEGIGTIQQMTITLANRR